MRLSTPRDYDVGMSDYSLCSAARAANDATVADSARTDRLATRNAALLAAYRDGHTIATIAKACGLSKEAVSKACGRPSDRGKVTS